MADYPEHVPPFDEDEEQPAPPFFYDSALALVPEPISNRARNYKAPKGLKTNAKDEHVFIDLTFLNLACAHGGGDPHAKMLSPTFAFCYQTSEWWEQVQGLSATVRGRENEVWRGRVYGQFAVIDHDSAENARAVWTGSRPR